MFPIVLFVTFLNEIINCITLELNKLWYIPECKRMLNTNNPYFSLTFTPAPPSRGTCHYHYLNGWILFSANVVVCLSSVGAQSSVLFGLSKSVPSHSFIFELEEFSCMHLYLHFFFLVSP